MFLERNVLYVRQKCRLNCFRFGSLLLRLGVGIRIGIRLGVGVGIGIGIGIGLKSTCIWSFGPWAESYDFALTSINCMEVPVLTNISIVAYVCVRDHVYT